MFALNAGAADTGDGRAGPLPAIRAGKARVMDGPGFWVAAVVAAVLVGMSKGGVPVVGMLGVPVLALVMSPVVAAGLLLPVYVVSDMFGLYAYRHAFDRRVLAILIPARPLGMALGWATASLVPEAAVTAAGRGDRRGLRAEPAAAPPRCSPAPRRAGRSRRGCSGAR